MKPRSTHLTLLERTVVVLFLAVAVVADEAVLSTPVAATTPEELTSQLVDASPSIISTGPPTRVHMPRQAKAIERQQLLTQMPDLKAMTGPELAQAFAERPAIIPSSDEPSQGPINPQANGAAGAVYADSRFGTGTDYASVANRRVGKLNMRFGGLWYMCTASVINKALLVTAAHCVFKYGQGSSGYPDVVSGNLQVTFEPGRDGTRRPFGTWNAQAVMVPAPYFHGDDTSQPGAAGIVTNNDIALVWLKPLNSRQIGDVVGGYFGYASNGWGFSAPAAGWGIPTAPATGLLTQFGYPAAFDSGSRMQISNAATYTMISAAADLKNMVRGTAMTGGSSGGPWIANYGVDAAVSGTNYGSNANRNIILGVTSWGYTDNSIKLQGASFFGTNKEFPSTYGTRGAGNLAKLMFDACDDTTNTAWNLKAKGLCV